MFAYLQVKKLNLKNSISDFMKEEKGAADIVAVILIVLVAVIAAVFFKDQIMALIENLFGKITENLDF